jgi:hypothetical protein
MEHGALRRTVGFQSLDHSAVGIAIVNLKCQVVLLSDSDVFAEALPLNLVEGLVSSIEVKAGFTYGNHPGLAGETSNRLERRVELTTSMKLRRFVGVQGHSSEHSGLAGRECHRPLGCLNIGAYLNDTSDPDRFCAIEVLAVIHRVLTIGKFEVSVIVIDRNLKGLWFRRISQCSIASL